jgi:hypothetical protein
VDTFAHLPPDRTPTPKSQKQWLGTELGVTAFTWLIGAVGAASHGKIAVSEVFHHITFQLQNLLPLLLK